MKRLWVVLTVAGVIVPYAVFVPWLLEHGPDVARLYDEATASAIAAFAWLDVLVCAVVVLVLAVCRIRQGLGRFWWVVVGTCVVGPSFGLPLYLYLRADDA